MRDKLRLYLDLIRWNRPAGWLLPCVAEPLADLVIEQPRAVDLRATE